MARDLRTIIFNGVNALERFGLFVDSVDGSPPAKVDNRQSIPYKSGSYNFDEIIGRPTYGDREMVYYCQIIENNSHDLEMLLTEINTWLLTPVKAVLQDTATPEYHFEGCCAEVTPSNSEMGFCELEIKFRLKPFKIWNYSINNDWKWDDFNFLADDVPIMEFEMVEGKSITINNPYAVPINFTPNFNASTVIVTIGTYKFALSSGVKSPFKLFPGENKLLLSTIYAGGADNILTIELIKEGL